MGAQRDYKLDEMPTSTPLPGVSLDQIYHAMGRTPSESADFRTATPTVKKMKMKDMEIQRIEISEILGKKDKEKAIA